jgi:hypothetical protein
MSRIASTSRTVAAILAGLSLVVLVASYVSSNSAEQLWERYQSDFVSLPIRLVTGFSRDADLIVHTAEPRRVDISFSHQSPGLSWGSKTHSEVNLSITFSRDGQTVYHAEYPPGWGVFGGGGEHGVSFYPFWSTPGAYHVSVQVHDAAPGLDGGDIRLVVAPNRDIAEAIMFKRYFARRRLWWSLWAAGVSCSLFGGVVLFRIFHHNPPNQALERTDSAE